MLLAFFCIAAGWTVSHTNGLSKQLRQLFANPPMDKEQFFVALKRIINPDVQGGSRFNPISHADIRRRIRALWADGCQKLQVTCTWEGQLENLTRIRPKTWKGYINRPVRDADKGPWNTIWTHTHRAQDSGSFYEELTPNEDITYYEFDVIPFPDSSLREQRIAAVRAVARGDNNVPTTGNGHAHSNDKVTDADTENERDESDSDSEADYEIAETTTAELFRQGHYTTLPVVAHMSGSDLNQLLTHPDTDTPTWAEKALSLQTRAGHRRALVRLMKMAQPLQKKRVTIAIMEHLHEIRLSKKWTWSTMLKNTTATQSALRLLPLYKKVTHGLALHADVFWGQGITSIQRYAREEKPRTPMAMTTETFRLAMNAERRTEQRLALMLMWFSAGRVGDVLQLRKGDIELHPDGAIALTFSHGKAVCHRGPYTVHTVPLDNIYLQLLRSRWTDNTTPAEADTCIFTITPPDMRSTYKAIHPLLEAKSVRRGSLQTMAREGVPHNVLMKYSGHLSEKTLLRYLNWGRITGATRAAMAEAGTALLL